MICPFLTPLFLIGVIGLMEPIPAVTGWGAETHAGQVTSPSHTHTPLIHTFIHSEGPSLAEPVC